MNSPQMPEFAVIAEDPAPLVLYSQGSGTFLTITKDGQIVAGEGLSQDEATQAAAKMLAEQFSALHQKQAAEIASLRATINQIMTPGESYKRLNATIATARREGMERAVAILRARHRGLEHIREWREAQHCADEIEAEIRATPKEGE